MLIELQSIRCYGCRAESGIQWFTGKLLLSKLRRGRSMWVMHGFEFHLCLSVCLSVSLSLSWSSESIGVVCLLLICSGWLDQIRFSLFLPWRSRIGQKITSAYFYFLTNFIYISLCTDPMRRNPFSPFWRKSQYR